MADLGTLKRIDPRKEWQTEAQDFTPWLAQHLDHLGEVLEMELELVGSEADVGDFAVDILAKDLGRDRFVIIENQLEPTDHTHLGQVITYAAGKDAGTVVWVCREFREEHRSALDWLNRGMESTGTQFFGIVIELVQIDDSKPAVNFRVVASPNKWTRATRSADAAGEATDKQLAYRQFFQRLIDELRDKHRFTNARASQLQSWYSFSAGISGVSYSASFARGGRLRAEVYLGSSDGDWNWEVFERLRGDAEAIEHEFGEKLEWEELEGKISCRVACYRAGTIDDPQDALDEYLVWFVERLMRLKKVFGPRLGRARG